VHNSGGGGQHSSGCCSCSCCTSSVCMFCTQPMLSWWCVKKLQYKMLSALSPSWSPLCRSVYSVYY